MTDAFFPPSKSFAWVTFRVTTTDLYSQSLVGIEFAVHLNNPVVLFAATMTTAITSWFLGYIHTFLRDTANIARGTGPQPLN